MKKVSLFIYMILLKKYGNANDVERLKSIDAYFECINTPLELEMIYPFHAGQALSPSFMGTNRAIYDQAKSKVLFDGYELIEYGAEERVDNRCEAVLKCSWEYTARKLKGGRWVINSPSKRLVRIEKLAWVKFNQRCVDMFGFETFSDEQVNEVVESLHKSRVDGAGE